MPIEIQASVGRGGENRRPDTREIQRALNEVFPSLELVVDGLCGSKTIRRIERFQRRFMTAPDGRVDPGGRTLRRLNSTVPSLTEDWSGDSQRWSQEKKLASLAPPMRPRVERTLAVLRAQGFQPKIVYAWRSVAVQAQLVEQGHSKVRFSFHNAQKPSGRPHALAVDVIDRRFAWTAKAATSGFWQAQGAAGKAEGLLWGGDWRSFKDWAHLQLHPNRLLAQVRRESGLA